MAREAVLLQVDTPTPTPTPFDGELGRPDILPEFIPLGIYQLVVSIILVLVAYYISRVVRQVLGRRIARRFKRPSVSRTILRGIQALIMVFAILTALSFMGLGLGNIALSVGVFSAVAGIILAPIIGNFISGVFVLTEQPYEIGDMIELVDTETAGFVEDITLLYTKVFTLDNTFLVMPNGEMRQRDVVNYSAEDTRVRLTLEVGVTYESDIGVARTQMEAAASEIDGIISGGPAIRIGSARYPAAPTCYIREFGNSEVLLRLRYWVNEPYKQTKIRSAVMTGVWQRFDEHDIEIPYPHRHMVFDDTSGELQVAFRESDEQLTAQRSGATRRGQPQDPEADPAVSTDAASEAATPPDAETGDSTATTDDAVPEDTTDSETDDE